MKPDRKRGTTAREMGSPRTRPAPSNTDRRHAPPGMKLDLTVGFLFAPAREKCHELAPGGSAVRPPEFALSDYFPIFLYLVIVAGLVLTILVLAQTIGPRRDTKIKLMPYESGMDPIGDARQHFDVKFYLIAVMFLVFDVELLFLYPWAVTAYSEAALPAALGRPIFWTVVVFLALLLVAYVYDWKKGVFRWR